jgi:hypothetical protein
VVPIGIAQNKMKYKYTPEDLIIRTDCSFRDTKLGEIYVVNEVKQCTGCTQHNFSRNTIVSLVGLKGYYCGCKFIKYIDSG